MLVYLTDMLFNQNAVNSPLFDAALGTLTMFWAVCMVGFFLWAMKGVS